MHTKPRRWRLGAWMIIAFTLTACGGEGGDESPGPDPFFRQAEGTGSLFKVIGATPDPPLRADYNAWMVTLATPDGAALTGCEIAADPRMPAHGHGTTPLPEVTPVDGVEGQYQVKPLNLFMAGLWEITFRYTCGDLEDEVAVTVVVES